MVQLSHPYMTTAKTIALTRRSVVDKIMSLLFNTMSRFVIAFLPRSKSPLISYHRDYLGHDSVSTYLEPDILECEAKWALGSNTTNKASGGDGIPIELFQILKDDAVKVLHSIMPANLENSAVATGLEKVSFHSNP